MAKGRKAGCPVDITDWVIQVKDVASADWTTVLGLRKLTRSLESTTEDGSSDIDLFEEPFITKRNVSYSFEGDLLYDPATGRFDAGQVVLREYSLLGGCEAGLDFRLADPYGHAALFEGIVESWDDSNEENGRRTISFDVLQVGEAEEEAYVLLTGIGFVDDVTPLAGNKLSLAKSAAAKEITIAFTPANATNKRFRIGNSKRGVATVTGLAEDRFTVTPVAAGVSNVTVACVSGGVTEVLEVTVTEA